MCCKNRAARRGGCHGRRYNACTPRACGTVATGQAQAPTVIYARRPTLLGMLFQHVMDKCEAKKQQQQQTAAFAPTQQMAIRGAGKTEDEKIMEEREAQMLWDQRRAEEQGIGRRIEVRGQNEEARISRVSFVTQLPSYGQAMRQWGT